MARHGARAMTVSLAAQAGSSVCCVCRREIIGVPNTSWGGKNAHRHCATRAFQTSHRQRPTLTEEQQRAAEAIEAAIEARKHFNLDGVAGTGKTIVLANVASRHEDAYLCAPTAKAASVVTMK